MVVLHCGHTRHTLTAPDGLIACELLECKRAIYPPVAEIGFVLNENVFMHLNPGELTIQLNLIWVRVVIESVLCYLTRSDA